MTATAVPQIVTLRAGVSLAVERYGSGPPLVFLHPEDGVLFTGAFVDELARRFEVVIPHHPGWPGSVRPSWMKSVGDVADAHLEFLGMFDAPLPVVGVSFGAWVAAEMATRCQHQISCLGLVAPLGIKVRDRETRDFVDIYATRKSAVQAALYGDLSQPPDLSRLDDRCIEDLAVAQEAVARYCWKPYMHNPTLPARLSRIGVPTLLVSGQQDNFALSPTYYSTYCDLIGDNASHVVLSDVGHRIEEEAPSALADALSEFITKVASPSASH
jgi:pimeloyl-ACP methyl ester carboxylesterase